MLPCERRTGRRARRYYSPPAGGARSALAVLVGVALSIGGCGRSLNRIPFRGWLADYEAAEQSAAAAGRPLLIFYKDPRGRRHDPTEAVLRSERIMAATRDYTRCVLVKTYTDDRRYVAQFGVERAPAVIVVHPDSTFHSKSGLMTESDVLGFLASAAPPGRVPVADAYLPREPSYHWDDSVASATARARESAQPALIVFYRALSRDWSELQRLLGSYEVHSRLAPLVHCRIGVWGWSGRRRDERFGALKLPAIVIARPDGTFDTMELPTTADAVALFADRALNPRRSPGAGAGDSVTTATSRPGTP